jgi:hypothetical protein
MASVKNELEYRLMKEEGTSSVFAVCQPTY